MSKEVKALAKGVSHSPRKVSEVASLVRNRTVADALVILSHTPRRASQPVQKVVASAKANAEHNHNLKPDTLVIKEITVTAGPRIKRYRPAAHGRALPFQRKTSHIQVIVTGEERQKKNAANRSSEPKATTRQGKAEDKKESK